VNQGDELVAIAIWFATSLVLTGLLVWLSVAVEPYFSPILLGPVLLGALLGSALAWLQRFWNAPPSRVSLGLVVIIALLAVAGQHVRHYQLARDAQIEDEAKLKAAQQSLPEFAAGQELGAPPTFRRFLSRGRPYWGGNLRGPAAWIAWGVDGALVILTATIASRFWLRSTRFCAECQSWFKPTREGRLEAAGVRELADEISTTVPKDVGAGRYRLLQCRSGCGDAELRLSWTVTGKHQPSALTATCRLDSAGRQRVGALLDRLACRKS
jgi:hypothetical protein